MNGELSTHWRKPVCGGNTRSIRLAAAFIRRPVRDGQNAQLLSRARDSS
jgi:hypothetical protein